MSLPTADDGCIKPQPDMSRPYVVGIAGKCQHTRIRAGAIVILAPNPEAAADYVRTWLRLPRTEVIGAAPYPDETVPFTDDQILDRAGKILMVRAEASPGPGHQENAAAATCILTALDIRQDRLS